jgi:hypothetical protein
VTVALRALLGREPDPDGLAYWTSSADLESFLRAVVDTEEHGRRVLLKVEAGGGTVS